MTSLVADIQKISSSILKAAEAANLKQPRLTDGWEQVFNDEDLKAIRDHLSELLDICDRFMEWRSHTKRPEVWDRAIESDMITADVEEYARRKEALRKALGAHNKPLVFRRGYMAEKIKEHKKWNRSKQQQDQ